MVVHVDRTMMEYSSSGTIRIIRDTLEEYVSIIGRDIHLSLPHGEKSNIEDGDDLFIKFWSVPRGSADTRIKIREAFGVPLVDGQSDAFEPTGFGQVFYDPTSGQAIFEYIGSTIFVLFDLPHNQENAGYLVRKVMELFIQLPTDKEDQRMWLVEVEQKRTEALLKMIAKRKNDLISSQLDEAREELAESRRELSGLQKRASLLSRRINEKKREIEALESVVDDMFGIDNAQDVLDELKQTFGDENVSGEGIYLWVTLSDPIYIDYGDKKYYLGRFKLRFNLTERGLDPRFFPIDMPLPSGAFHPHVYDNGTACWGDAGQVQSYHASRFEILQLVTLMRVFLESYNPGSEIRHITDFPFELIEEIEEEE